MNYTRFSHLANSNTKQKRKSNKLLTTANSIVSFQNKVQELNNVRNANKSSRKKHLSLKRLDHKIESKEFNLGSMRPKIASSFSKLHMNRRNK